MLMKSSFPGLHWVWTAWSRLVSGLVHWTRVQTLTGSGQPGPSGLTD